MWLKILVAVVLTLAVAQAMPCAQSNPPVTGELAASSAVKSILRDACYDCHSNETSWPWYSKLAPASWLVHYDVTEGRKRLNFSRWDAYTDDPGTLIQKLENIQKAIRAEDMPPWYYRLLHPKSRLSESQRDTVARWATAQLTASHSSD